MLLTHTYPRTGDPISAQTIAIQAVGATTITVNVGISNDEPELTSGSGYSDGTYTRNCIKKSTWDLELVLLLTSQLPGGRSQMLKKLSPGNGYNNTDVLGI